MIAKSKLWSFLVLIFIFLIQANWSFIFKRVGLGFIVRVYYSSLLSPKSLSIPDSAMEKILAFGDPKMADILEKYANSPEIDIVNRKKAILTLTKMGSQEAAQSLYQLSKCQDNEIKGAIIQLMVKQKGERKINSGMHKYNLVDPIELPELQKLMVDAVKGEDEILAETATFSSRFVGAVPGLTLAIMEKIQNAWPKYDVNDVITLKFRPDTASFEPLIRKRIAESEDNREIEHLELILAEVQRAAKLEKENEKM